jgi:hypothetical protein
MAIPIGASDYEFANGTEPIRVFAYKPATYRDGPLVVVFHGVARNAEDYRNFAINLAERARVLVVTPLACPVCCCLPSVDPLHPPRHLSALANLPPMVTTPILLTSPQEAAATAAQPITIQSAVFMLPSLPVRPAAAAAPSPASAP